MVHEFSKVSITPDLSDFFCLAIVLFVLFPWIALVIEAILWFFGVPPLFGFDTNRVAMAVIWPMAWTGVFALFN